ncbi:MAG TPA: hypothetical protein VJ969_04570 [Desulfopila sp.]|nr:hypothetical protein [Desulfopila sp.]
MKRNIYRRTAFFLSLALFIFFFSSCTVVPNTMVQKSHRGDKALTAERIALESTDEEKTWRTGELAVHYNIRGREDSFEIRGFVEVDSSVTYTFPLAEYLSLFLYLLDGDGVAVSRRTVRPNIAFYSTFTDKAGFSATIEKDHQVPFIAFGYRGSFFSIEDDERGGRRGYEKIEWEIYHDPFP